VLKLATMTVQLFGGLPELWNRTAVIYKSPSAVHNFGLDALGRRCFGLTLQTSSEP
jgi:hypothetical protein